MNITITSPTDIGAEIKKLRWDVRGTDQRDLAKKVGISVTHLSSIENGGNVSLKTLVAIFEELGVGLSFAIVPDKGTQEKIQSLSAGNDY